jgi:carboxylate-amine ligase
MDKKNPLDESKQLYLPFPASKSCSLGVEMEVWLVDRETGKLAPEAPKILEILAEEPHFKSELFRSIIEITTDVCHSVQDVYRQLSARLRRLRDVVSEMNLDTICTGTHPFSHWREVPMTANRRYQELVDKMGWPARRLLICGIHVHVGVQSAEHAVAVMNSMTCFVPHLLALSGSSPYWAGVDTSMASSRCKIFDGLPTAGLPPQLPNWNAFAALMHTLMASGSIASIREIWWDIRPHPSFGTVEIRSCDGINTMPDLLGLVALVQAWVALLQDRYNRGLLLPSLAPWTLRENKWRAARYGLDAHLVINERGETMSLRRHLQDWLVKLKPFAEELGGEQALARIYEMLKEGNSSMRQRRHYHQHGSLSALVGFLRDEHAQSWALSNHLL